LTDLQNYGKGTGVSRNVNAGQTSADPPPTPEQAFGVTVAELRHALRLSQEEFALRRGEGGDRTYLSKIEKGDRFPSQAYIESVADAYPMIRDELLRAWHECNDRRQIRNRRPINREIASLFEKFFGREIARIGVTLVYPVFHLTGASVEALTQAHIPPQLYYGKQGTPFSKSHWIDVPVALAENDVRALVYVSSLLQRHTTIRPEMANDTTVVGNCDRSFISFGFSSNDCTHMYLASSAQPLFEIVDEQDTRRYLEYLRLPDGRSFRSNDDMNIGIIVRYRPDSSLYPSRRWFFCAGLGPRGTSGAAWFLANNWQALHDAVGISDFIAVLEVQVFGDQTAKLEHIYTPDR
jgi:transcriptional regulator with XRE-family HTH domain